MYMSVIGEIAMIIHNSQLTGIYGKHWNSIKFMPIVFNKMVESTVIIVCMAWYYPFQMTLLAKYISFQQDK